jgi:hypothetical protein
MRPSCLRNAAECSSPCTRFSFRISWRALAYLRSLTDFDQNRLAVVEASFGGIQTMLAVERRSGYRVAVGCSAAAQTWRELPHFARPPDGRCQQGDDTGILSSGRERLRSNDRAVRGRLITVDQTKTLGSKVLKSSPLRSWVRRAL